MGHMNRAGIEIPRLNKLTSQGHVGQRNSPNSSTSRRMTRSRSNTNNIFNSLTTRN